MSTWVGLIVELLRIPGVRECSPQFNDLVNSTPHALVTGRKENLRAKPLNEKTPLQGDGVRHSKDTLVPASSSHPCKRDPHIAARGFGDDTSWT